MTEDDLIMTSASERVIAPGAAGRVRVRVAALVCSGDDILIVEHSADGNRWKCFPGGGLEVGESLEECVRPELDEELRMTCLVGPLVAIGYHLDESTHSVEFFFHCTSEGGVPRPTGGSLTGAWFVDRRQLLELSVFPLELSAELASSSVEAVSGARYFGRFR
ncbi:NUDIX domain-containing protein [Nonomuraea phyllanthi]|uniref:NUDIX domain-containing protein n=1 Tax=Nonomuraea phyllanthi TaxID=2219224 RepID=UPI001293C4A1|nr:NUDIX domain-containing protein [Nonomuraea phyllanthi]QFY11608.1 NUDIX domain-containing protein [Nonomuraea phyllanthi]